MLYGVADYTALLLQSMIVARLLYDVLRSHDYEGAKCYTTRLFIGSQGTLRKFLNTHFLFCNTPLYFFVFFKIIPHCLEKVTDPGQG